MNFAQANSVLKSHWRRKLANNTYLERHDDCIVVRLYSTNIIRFYPDGRTTLHHGGWETRTTKDRLNRFLDRYGVYSQNRTWFLWAKGQRLCTFQNGMEISPTGDISGGGSVEEADEAYRLSRRESNRRSSIKSYWKGLSKRPYYVGRLQLKDLGGWDRLVKLKRACFDKNNVLTKKSLISSSRRRSGGSGGKWRSWNGRWWDQKFELKPKLFSPMMYTGVLR